MRAHLYSIQVRPYLAARRAPPVSKRAGQCIVYEFTFSLFDADSRARSRNEGGLEVLRLLNDGWDYECNEKTRNHAAHRVPPPLDLPHTAGTGQNIAVSPIITLHPVQDVNTYSTEI